MTLRDELLATLIPDRLETHPMRQLLVYLCLAATAAAVFGAILTYSWGHTSEAIGILITASLLPLGIALLKRNQSPAIIGHYMAAILFLQILMFAAIPAVGAVALVALSAGVALLPGWGSRAWLGALVIYGSVVALRADTEVESVTATVAILCGVVVYLIVQMTQRLSQRSIKEATANRRRTENQVAVMQRMIDEHFDGYVQLDTEEILSTSNNISSLLGYTPEEFNSHHLDFYLHPEESDFLDKLGVGQEPGRHEIRLRHANGMWLWVEAYLFPDLVSGIPSRSILVLRNYDNQRKVSEQLLQAQRLQSMGNMAAGVAHDFNNMLTVIMGLVEELDDSAISRDIRETASKAAVLTNKLLTFGHGTIRSSEIHDLSYLMSDLGPLVRHALDSRYVLIESYINEPVLVRIEEGLFEQVVVNMVNNAREAMPEGGEVEISLSTVELAENRKGRPTGDFALIEVRDTGSGMDDVTRARAFDPFFSTKQGTSSGLGLSSCYGIVSQYGGFIDIDTYLDGGTTIQIYLPIAETRDYEPQLELVDAPMPVLVIDDDPSVVGVIKRALNRAGYLVKDFSDAGSALNYFETHHVALVITDVVMPKMSGAELVKKMREISTDLPVLFISGFTGEHLDHWEADAMTSFLAKPFRGEEIVARTESLISIAADKLAPAEAVDDPANADADAG